MSLRTLAKLYKEMAEKIMERARNLDKLPKAEAVKISHAIRDAAIIAQMTEDEIYEELKKLANQFGGCVSCKYSAPTEDNLRLTSRTCTLGLSQSTCVSYERIED